jgi:cytochrome b6-f complex iron-sulfur subunit
MSGTAVGIIAGVVLALLLIVFLLTTGMRRDMAAATGVLSRETKKRDRSAEALEEVAPATPAPVSGRAVERAAVLERTATGTLPVPARAAPPAPVGPVDPETYGTTRRMFLNRSVTGLMVLSLSAFGVACIGFLWPSLSGGFGSKINAGNLTDIMQTLQTTKAPVYVPAGRFYLQPYPASGIPNAKRVYSGAVLTGMEAGLVALYQKCVHLGCRVPWCQTSQWFECPCHGSKYNRVGEKKGGPAPRGLDRFGVSVGAGVVTVDTTTVVLGPPIGTNTTGQEQEGPHCA